MDLRPRGLLEPVSKRWTACRTISMKIVVNFGPIHRNAYPLAAALSALVDSPITYTNIMIYIPSPLDSILLAIFTVSPNRQYLGMVRPTTPAAQPPQCIPLRNNKRKSGLCRTYSKITIYNMAHQIKSEVNCMVLILFIL